MLFHFLDGGTPLADFEQWLYTNQYLEDIFGEEDYLELISMDFTSKHTSHEANKIITKHIDVAQYSTWQLKRALKALGSEEYDAVEILRFLWMKGGGGYQFLKKIGIPYLFLKIFTIPTQADKANWSERAFRRQRRKLDHYLKYIKPYAIKILTALEEGKIVLKNETDYEIDEDLKNDLIDADPHIVPKWWQVWKWRPK